MNRKSDPGPEGLGPNCARKPHKACVITGNEPQIGPRPGGPKVKFCTQLGRVCVITGMNRKSDPGPEGRGPNCAPQPHKACVITGNEPQIGPRPGGPKAKLCTPAPQSLCDNRQ